MARPPRAPFVEDVLTVLIESFDYLVDNIGDNGVILIKEADSGKRAYPLALPYGDDTIPFDVLEHVFRHADFTMVEFRRALNAYLRA